MDILLLKITLVSMVAYIGSILINREIPNKLIINIGGVAFYTMLISSILTILVWQV